MSTAFCLFLSCGYGAGCPAGIIPPASGTLRTMGVIETKPFYQTSEFYITVLTNLGLILSAASNLMPPQYAAFAAVVVNGLYTVARGIAKSGNPVGASPQQNIVAEKIVMAPDSLPNPAKQG